MMCRRTALDVEHIVRHCSAVPATTAVLNGRLCVGEQQLVILYFSIKVLSVKQRLHQIHVARIKVVSALVSARRTLLRTCIRRHVDGYKLLVRDNCRRLHVSGVNAA